jgi:hypothetical protein
MTAKKTTQARNRPAAPASSHFWRDIGRGGVERARADPQSGTCALVSGRFAKFARFRRLMHSSVG